MPKRFEELDDFLLTVPKNRIVRRDRIRFCPPPHQASPQRLLLQPKQLRIMRPLLENRTYTLESHQSCTPELTTSPCR
jgi:hypothetical protein